MNPTRSLLLIYGAAASAAAVGLIVTFAPPEVTVVATMVGIGALILAIAFGIHWLEYHEFLAARTSISSAARNARTVIRDKINASDIAQVIRDAKSFDEVQATLHDCASTFRFAHMKLSDPASRRRAGGRVTQELQALKLWKLEYPIVHESVQDYDGLCLTIWCSLEIPERPAGSERIAQIVGPAIADWVRTKGGMDRRSPLAEDLVLRHDGELVRPKVEDSALIRDLEWEPQQEKSLGA